MVEDLMDDLTLFAVGIVAPALIVLTLDKAQRTKGKRVEYHIEYPRWSFHYSRNTSKIWSSVLLPAGVLVIGTLLPIYESIKGAVSTGDRDDDVAWLQFWLASGSFTYVTKWMDAVAEYSPSQNIGTNLNPLLCYGYCSHSQMVWRWCLINHSTIIGRICWKRQE